MYLLDADWVISFLNGRASAIALMERLADDGTARKHCSPSPWVSLPHVDRAHRVPYL